MDSKLVVHPPADGTPVDGKGGRIDLRFSGSDLRMIDSVWVPYGFKSRGLFAKASVRLVASRLQDNLRAGCLDDGDIECVFEELSGGLEHDTSVDWDGFYRAAAKRDFFLSLPPREDCGVHPFAARFLREEFAAVQVGYPCVSTCSVISRDDLIQSTTLRLLGLGANGCSAYEEYRDKAFKIFRL